MLARRSCCARRTPTRASSSTVEAARAVPGVRAVLGPEDELGGWPAAAADRRARVRRGRRRGDRGRRRRRRRGGDRRRSALRWSQLPFVVDLEQGLAEQRFTRGSQRGARAATSRPASPRPTCVVEAEYRTPAQVQQALEPHCAVADWAQDELSVLGLDAGHLRRARPARRELRARARPRARHVRVHGRRLRRQAGRDDRGPARRRTSRGAPAGPCALVNDRRAESVATGHRAATMPELPVGARRDGTLTAIEATAVVAIGVAGCSCRRCWCRPSTLYRCENVRATTFPVSSTSASPTRSARPA